MIFGVRLTENTDYILNCLVMSLRRGDTHERKNSLGPTPHQVAVGIAIKSSGYLILLSLLSSGLKWR